jgi:hypothetical protein
VLWDFLNPRSLCFVASVWNRTVRMRYVSLTLAGLPAGWCYQYSCWKRIFLKFYLLIVEFDKVVNLYNSNVVMNWCWLSSVRLIVSWMQNINNRGDLLWRGLTCYYASKGYALAYVTFSIPSIRAGEMSSLDEWDITKTFLSYFVGV